MGSPPGVVRGHPDALPRAPCRAQPGIELRERLGAQRVEALLAVGSRAHETGLAQHAQMLRDPRLAQSDPIDQLPHRPLARSQQVEDSTTVRLGHGAVGAHAVLLPNGYACRDERPMSAGRIFADVTRYTFVVQVHRDQHLVPRGLPHGSGRSGSGRRADPWRPALPSRSGAGGHPFGPETRRTATGPSPPRTRST